MKINIGKWVVFSLVCMMFTITVFELEAQARAGGGRSTGSRGSRSYSRPTAPSSPISPMQQSAPQARPYSPPYQQPGGGGFFRSMAGGIVGGMLGGMLFRSLGFGGMGGGMGGSGIGLFEILLIAGIGYFIYRMIKKKREEAEVYQQSYAGNYEAPGSTTVMPAMVGGPADLETGLGHIRQMDYSFDPQRFKDDVMDIFFRIQGAWMNRDLSSVTVCLTDEMRRNLQADVDTMLREKRVNRLENIAVRSVEPVEAWQEAGQDYITTLIYANLLDYTTDDATGAVVAGSKTEPVKFEEYWTFTRSVGPNPWRLSAIEQK